MTTHQVQPDGSTVPVNTEHTEVPAPAHDGGSGYINVSTSPETEHQKQQAEQVAQSQQQYQELSEKLGVDLDSQTNEKNETQLPNQGGQLTEQQKYELARLQAQNDYLKKFSTEEGKRFRKEFTDYLGVDPIEAFKTINETQQTVQEIRKWRAEQEKQQALTTLQNEWGDDFEPTWVAVREEFNKLPNDLKAKLDNVDGARLLAAKVRQDGLVATHQSVPSFQRSSASATGNIRATGSTKGYIKTSDFFNDKVSEAEYIQALKSGRVIRDM